MDRIHYAGGELVTGSRIAAALVEYAVTLAQHGTAASVVVPVYDDQGERASANMLVGPASQLVTESIHTELDELEDDDLVRAIEERTARLHGTPAGSSVASDVDDTMPNWVDEL